MMVVEWKTADSRGKPRNARLGRPSYNVCADRLLHPCEYDKRVRKHCHTKFAKSDSGVAFGTLFYLEKLK
jgi:hypothetical protein